MKVNINRRNVSVILFCKVVDNFGDAGFCLRLSKRLTLFGYETVIYCDDISLIKRLNHNVLKIFNNYCPRAVSVLEYKSVLKNFNPIKNYLILELFQVNPPKQFLFLIEENRNGQRIIIDHLSTNDLSESFQGKPSPDNHTLVHFSKSLDKDSSPAATRTWCSPSFSKKNGGLIPRDLTEVSPSQREQMRDFILSHPNTKTYGTYSDQEKVFIILMFTYEDITLPSNYFLKEYSGVAVLKPNGIIVSQFEFDAMLHCTNLNFVRGEDSFISAHFASAGRWKVPFFWNPYRQPEDCHVEKFFSWKKRFTALKEDYYWNIAEKIVRTEFDASQEEWQNIAEKYNLIKEQMHKDCFQIINRYSFIEMILRLSRN